MSEEDLNDETSDDLEMLEAIRAAFGDEAAEEMESESQASASIRGLARPTASRDRQGVLGKRPIGCYTTTQGGLCRRPTEIHRRATGSNHVRHSHG